MKMKKVIAALLAAGILLSFAACENGAPSGKPESSQVGGGSSSGESSAPETAGMGTQAFGKVTSIAGNEMTLSMANVPAPEEKESSGESSQNTDPGTMTHAIPATELTPAQEGGGKAMERPKTELEYTGEEKDFTIPAGAPITGADGQNETMEAIQKGSVLILNLDEAGNIVSIGMWE